MKPVNPNATREAEKLLNYLYEVAGNGIITGQHTQTNPMEEVVYIKEKTGWKPKLQGFELLGYSPNINYDDASEACLTEVEENKGTMATALKWAKETDGIVAMCFHWFSPIGGRDKAFYTEHTDFDASKVLEEGTEERKAFYSDMDVIAEELKKFQDENIPILFRPFHEADGRWFWWGAKGDAVGRELYKLMFEYYVNQKHLNNLLWVWNSPAKEGYPGDEYVDVISRDIYLTEKKPTDYKAEYEELIANTTDRKVAALGEVGYIPDVDMLKESRVPWAFYMTWSKEFCIGEQYNTVEETKKMYASDYAIKIK
ncbi:MAG: beta-mannosidase [Lachnospiraceae bacterium]|nr:beta-mannosidase [Lachnospiraceae bacterium]